jgi:hypothetical protein
MAAETEKLKTVPGIRVRTTKVGFRRGGREWTGTAEVPVSEFTKEQLAQIRKEPLLVVDDIKIEQPGADDVTAILMAARKIQK